MLQLLVQVQETYFKNPFALKTDLDKPKLSSNEKLFTYNAVLMYTNIDPDNCIARPTAYLLSAEVTTRF